MKHLFKLVFVLPFFMLACEDEEEDRLKFIGSYDTTAYCTSSDTSVSDDTTMFTMLILVPDPDTDVNEVEIVDLFGTPITATVSGNTISFTGMATGSGTLSGDQLDFDFVVTTTTCTAVGLKN